MKSTNLKQLTESQELTISTMMNESFSKQHSDDWNHFSFNGTRLNFSTMKPECIFEIHTEENGSFWGLIDINESNKGLKRSIKFIEQ